MSDDLKDVPEPDGYLICGKCKQFWAPRHACDPEDLPPPPKETLQ